MARPRQVSDDQILSAMRDAVLEHGPNVSLELVASPLDVSVPAILKRYGNRQALMLAALRPPETPQWVLAIHGGPDDRPLRTQLLELFGQIYDFMQEMVPCMVALRESGIPPSKVFDGKPPESGLKALSRWLGMARKKGLVTAPETNAPVYAIIGALQTRAFFSHLMNVRVSKRERREYLEELATLFTRALTD